MLNLKNWLRNIAPPLTKSLFAILVGIGGGVILLLVTGYDPVGAYYYLFHDSFLTKYGILRTLAYASPLILTALTWSIGMKVGIFNIGAQGQLMIGAGAAVAASTFVLPTGLHLLVAMIFAMVAGMAWAVPAALLKVKRGIHEVVSTIMLNWIGIYLLRYLVSEPLASPVSAQRSIKVAQSSRFPVLFEGSTLTAAIFVSIGFAVLVYVILWHTRIGQHLRASGLDRESARNSGIDVTKMMIIAFMLGGVAAGLAGCTLTAGQPPSWSISDRLGALIGFGFEGIGVGMIGRNHPIGGIFAAIFFGGLITGQTAMQMEMQIPSEITMIITGIIIIAVAIPALLEIIEKRVGKE